MTGSTLAQLASEMAAGRLDSRGLTLGCLDAIAADPDSRVAFIKVDAAQALSQAGKIDLLRLEGKSPSPYAGIPIAIKDLFDVAGEVTRAGSVVLDRGAAQSDADAVASLREAGFVFVGRSNMTEFAFSGLGMNPHYGTPTTPWRRDEVRLAGGSTSGGAMAVSLGMAHAALGSDTGGSCRIPAAWCGLVGFKPTARRISRAGTVPLSTTLDSIGSIARSVSCCAAIDALLAGEPDELEAVSLEGKRFGVVTNVALDGMSEAVAEAFQDALQRLETAGATVSLVKVEPFDRIAGLNAKGGFAAWEAYAWHRDLLEERRDEYDPRVSVRISRGAAQTAEDYAGLVEGRARLIDDMEPILADFDALLMPTTPILPPRVAELADDDEYGRINLLALRNPTLINMIDGCAISVPIVRYDDDAAPVGLMIAAGRNEDRRLLSLAAAVEAVVSH